MKVKISNQPPPKEIYDKAVEIFGVDFYKGATFTVDDTIYCKEYPSLDLLEHEKIHIRQQATNYKEWWNKYFADKDFRLNQELEAYRGQYKWVINNIKDRNQRAKYLMFFAQSLSGTMYGNLITLPEALTKIKL